MSDVNTAIMDAAEQRMRAGGFHGFSFREIAADVGIKSSSVHYHFPTKEKLAAAVVRRYTAAIAERVDGLAGDEPDAIKRWTKAFRSTLIDKRMCPCVVLAAGAIDLPPEVAGEIQRFYKVTLEMMAADGLANSTASEFLATITGAMVIANALGDASEFDRATSDLMAKQDALAA